MKAKAPVSRWWIPNVTTPSFKSWILSISILMIVGVMAYNMMRFNTTDIIPQLKPINTEAIKKLGPFTVRVKTGMFIKNFPVFDVSKNTFLIDSILWFEFDTDEMNLETVERFSIDNGSIKYKSPPDIKVFDSRIFAKFNVLFELKTDLNFHKFPFEDHRLPILLSNDFVTPDEMYYVVDGSSFQVRSEIAPAGWKFSDMSVDAGIMPLELDKQDASKKSENPKALFILNFTKTTPRRALVIFIPLFSVIFLSLMAFVMNVANTVGKVTLATTALTGLLGYRFVIEQMIPQVGYFTTTDNIYILLLVISLLNFFIQLLITRYFMVNGNSDPGAPEKIERVSSVIFVLMLLFMVGMTTYYVLS